MARTIVRYAPVRYFGKSYRTEGYGARMARNPKVQYRRADNSHGTLRYRLYSTVSLLLAVPYKAMDISLVTILQPLSSGGTRAAFGGISCTRVYFYRTEVYPRLISRWLRKITRYCSSGSRTREYEYKPKKQNKSRYSYIPWKHRPRRRPPPPRWP